MAIYYVDFENGNDANNGTTFALRKKTIVSLSSTPTAGDTIRVMASPDETLVGNATWTYQSKTVTLASAVTANISDCETAWTPTANVTATADTVTFKENTKSAKLVIATAFTTGLVAYVATGALDLSGYQQVSFWINNSAAIAASTLSLRLCSDAAGVTTVNTIAIPALPNSQSLWTPITVDLGAALGSSIQSVALYADLDPGAVTIQLDNIFACKASSAGDSLTLHSLIGKAHNLKWAASTAYALNAIRKPSNPNRNGFQYKATTAGTTGSTEPTWPEDIGLTVTDGTVVWTCNDYEETWLAIQSINGTTVKIDNDSGALGNTGAGYSGVSETVAMYKREPIKQALQGNFVGTTANTNLSGAGTPAASLFVSGGWDRTAMTTQSGETWQTGNNGLGSSIAFLSGGNYTVLDNYHSVRMGSGIYLQNTVATTHRNVHHHHFSTGGLVCGNTSNSNQIVRGASFCNGKGSAFTPANGFSRFNNVTVHGNFANFIPTFGTPNSASFQEFTGISAKNNAGNTSYIISSAGNKITVRNLTTANNSVGAVVNSGNYSVTLNNFTFTEATPFSANSQGANGYVYSQKHGGVADSHYIQTDGGTIVSATDQRNTASGISWKFRPTSTYRNASYPLQLSVVKIACLANTLVTVNIWTRRDNTNIQGKLIVLGGQIAGIGGDVSVLCTPSINTWAQSSALTFTPTENGVVEVFFQVWDGVGTTNNFWIDDVTIS